MIQNTMHPSEKSRDNDTSDGDARLDWPSQRLQEEQNVQSNLQCTSRLSLATLESLESTPLSVGSEQREEAQKHYRLERYFSVVETSEDIDDQVACQQQQKMQQEYLEPPVSPTAVPTPSCSRVSSEKFVSSHSAAEACDGSRLPHIDKTHTTEEPKELRADSKVELYSAGGSPRSQMRSVPQSNNAVPCDIEDQLSRVLEMLSIHGPSLDRAITDLEERLVCRLLEQTEPLRAILQDVQQLLANGKSDLTILCTKNSTDDIEHDCSEHLEELGLTVKVYEELKQIFDSVDLDRSGTIDAREMHAASEKYGTPIPIQKVEIMFESLDPDGNGEMDFDLFVKFIRDFSQELSVETSGSSKEKGRSSSKGSCNENVSAKIRSSSKDSNDRKSSSKGSCNENVSAKNRSSSKDSNDRKSSKDFLDEKQSNGKGNTDHNTGVTLFDEVVQESSGSSAPVAMSKANDSLSGMEPGKGKDTTIGLLRDQMRTQDTLEKPRIIPASGMLRNSVTLNFCPSMKTVEENSNCQEDLASLASAAAGSARTDSFEISTKGPERYALSPRAESKESSAKSTLGPSAQQMKHDEPEQKGLGKGRRGSWTSSMQSTLKRAGSSGLKRAGSFGAAFSRQKTSSSMHSTSNGELEQLASFFDNVLRRTSQASLESGTQVSKSLRNTLKQVNQELSGSELFNLQNISLRSQRADALTGLPIIAPRAPIVDEFWPGILRVILKISGILPLGYNGSWLESDWFVLRTFAAAYPTIIIWILISFVIYDIIAVINHVYIDPSENILRWVIPKFIKISLAVATPIIHWWLHGFLRNQTQDMRIVSVFLNAMGRKDSLHQEGAKSTSLSLFLVMAVWATYHAFVLSSKQYESDLFLYGDNTFLFGFHTLLSLFCWLIFLAFVSVISLLCNALQLVVEAFGNRLVTEGTESKVSNTLRIQDIYEGWQTLSALVRSISFSTQWAMSNMMLLVSAVMLLGGFHHAMTDGEDLWFTMLCQIVSAVVMLLLLLRAAKITTRCETLPTIVNSLSRLGNSERHLLVQFMQSSGSGYRLFDSPMTSWFVAQVGYLILMGFILVFQSVLTSILS